MTARKPTSKVYRTGPKLHTHNRGNQNNKGNKGVKVPRPRPAHVGKLVGLLLSLCLAHTAQAQVLAHFRHHGWYTLPDSVQTPGDTLSSDTAVVCHRRTSSIRSVSKKIHELAHSEYGTKESATTRYEVDHLISLELGGSNSIKNLWPQIYPEAYEKDKVENELHKLVCDGKISLRAAQVAISKDWVALRDSLSNNLIPRR